MPWTGARHWNLGQAMTEFALVAPMLLFMLFGVLDASLLMFSSGTTRFAAATAARIGSEEGNRPGTDAAMLGAVKSSGLTTSLFSLNYVEIRKQVLTGTQLGDDTPDKYMRYTYAGGGLWNPCTGPCNWPEAGRGVTVANDDFMKVTINWTYQWKSGFILGAPAVTQQSVYTIRLEPQELS